MKRQLAGLGFFLVLFLLPAWPARAADTSQTIAFRGCDASLTGAVDLRLRLFDAANGGNRVFEETQTGVPVDAGCASVLIGNATPLSAGLFNANPSLWVAFAREATPDTELGGNRTPVTANGYAFRATTADRAAQATTSDQLGGVPAAGYLQTTGGSLNNSSDTSVVSVTNTGNGSALTAVSQSAQGVAGFFQNSVGGDLLRGQGAGSSPVFRVFNDGGAYFNGNVGIGAPPTEKLIVQTAPDNYGVLHTDGEVVMGSWIGAGTAGSNGGWFGTRSDHPLRFFAANSPVRMTIARDGNVGIGTTNPQAPLDVNGNINYGQLSKLDVAASATATVRVADFLLGHPQRRGAPGRAFVDNGQNGLVINFGRDWSRTWIGSDLVVDGGTSTKFVQISGGADLSEKFEVTHGQNEIEPGMVVAIDPANPGKLAVSAKAYDRRVVGIVSGAGGVQPGMLMGQSGTLADGNHPVALTGRVYVWADASNGPIVPGDLLTTSNVPGHAMKVMNFNKAQGAILGKAMTGLNRGRGLVLALVTLQ